MGHSPTREGNLLEDADLGWVKQEGGSAIALLDRLYRFLRRACVANRRVLHTERRK